MVGYRGRLCRMVGAGVLSIVAVACLSCARAQPGPSPPTTGPTSPSVSAEDLKAAREQLVQRLIRLGYLKSPAIIKAMRQTPRHRFISRDLWPHAYADHPLPIGHEQTISAPSIVAVMTELIQPSRSKVVLEIGTGSGYQAAVLGSLCKHVYTIEIVPELGKAAERTLKQLGHKNVTVRVGDGYRGWKEHAPFDGVMVTCAPERVPGPLVEQLKEGGRMVIPVGKKWNQQLYLMRKQNGKLERQATLPVLFVPMTGESETAN